MCKQRELERKTRVLWIKFCYNLYLRASRFRIEFRLWILCKLISRHIRLGDTEYWYPKRKFVKVINFGLDTAIILTIAWVDASWRWNATHAKSKCMNFDLACGTCHMIHWINWYIFSVSLALSLFLSLVRFPICVPDCTCFSAITHLTSNLYAMHFCLTLGKDSLRSG